MKIRQVGNHFLRVDGRTNGQRDIKKLKVVMCSFFGNSPASDF